MSAKIFLPPAATAARCREHGGLLRRYAVARRDRFGRGGVAAAGQLFRSPVAATKVAIYFAAIAGGIGAVAVDHTWSVALGAAVFLGIVYAHGLELQHETLHGVLCKTKAQNRMVGTLLGLPMLTTYSETRAAHLHHHRYVGTELDVHDRDCRDFAGVRAIIAHVFSLARLLDFAGTLLALQRGTYAGVLTPPAHRAAKAEFVTTALVMLGLLAGFCLLDCRIALWGWVVPALVVAPVVHFLMTSAEHLGCARTAPALTDNTRSYAASRLWSYLINYDNYHIEHHLRPSMPFHCLPHFYAARNEAAASQSSGYGAAMRQVGEAILACYRADR